MAGQRVAGQRVTGRVAAGQGLESEVIKLTAFCRIVPAHTKYA